MSNAVLIEAPFFNGALFCYSLLLRKVKDQKQNGHRLHELTQREKSLIVWKQEYKQLRIDHKQNGHRLHELTQRERG